MKAIGHPGVSHLLFNKWEFRPTAPLGSRDIRTADIDTAGDSGAFDDVVTL